MDQNLISRFEDDLRTHGVDATLKILNQRVSHRFTAIFRLDKDQLKIVQLVDKLDDSLTAPLSPVPFDNSFCELVMRDGAVMTDNSVDDKRFDGKFSQGVFISYVGLPLVQPGGGLFGSLCHLDYAENKIDEDEFIFLQNIAGVVSRYV